MVLVHAGFHIRGRSLGVNAERAHPEHHAGPRRADRLAERADERVDIGPAPAGPVEAPSGGAVGCVGFVIRKRINIPVVFRIRVEIVVEVDACDVIPFHQVAGDIHNLALDLR